MSSYLIKLGDDTSIEALEEGAQDFFRQDPVAQLTEALSIWFKYHDEVLESRVIFTRNDLKKATLLFVQRWIQLTPVERTFYIIDMEKRYEEEIRNKPLLTWEFGEFH